MMTATSLVSASTQSILTALSTQGSATLLGHGAIGIVRTAIDELVRIAGIEIVYDPASAPDLLDAVGVVGIGAAHGAALGGGVGLVAGVIFGAPLACLMIGAAVGGIAGADRGVRGLKRGLRVRATWKRAGVPEFSLVSAASST